MAGYYGSSLATTSASPQHDDSGLPATVAVVAASSLVLWLEYKLRPAALVGATCWLLLWSPATVVCCLASGTDETAGLLPRNLRVDSHDRLLGYHYSKFAKELDVEGHGISMTVAILVNTSESVGLLRRHTPVASSSTPAQEIIGEEKKNHAQGS